jgi:hypothetical protein
MNSIPYVHSYQRYPSLFQLRQQSRYYDRDSNTEDPRLQTDTDPLCAICNSPVGKVFSSFLKRFGFFSFVGE